MATTYSQEKSIHSCFISKETVAELEAYVIKRLVELEQGEESQITAGYRVTITDTSGTEKLSSINSVTEPKFPNDTKSISLRYYNRLGANNSCTLSVKFTTDRIGTEYKIDLTAEDAKKKVRDTVLHIDDILKKHWTWSWIVHPTLVCLFVVLIVSCGAFAVGFFPAVSFAAKGDSVTGLIAGIIGAPIGIIVPSLFLFVLPRLFPYITFDTKLNEGIRSRISWLVWGIVLAVLVTIPLGYAMRYLFDWLLGKK
jgi:hypothetical protein